jgi:hypothetical protein
MMKERVGEILLEASEEERNSQDFLVETVTAVLEEMKGDKPQIISNSNEAGNWWIQKP